MKKVWMIVSSVVLAMLSTSCLQQYATLSLKKDGSGTVTEKTIMGAQMLAMMGQFSEPGQDPFAQMVEEAKTKSAANAKKMGEGVTVKEVKALDEKGSKGFVVVYEFKDINKLKYTFGQGLKDDEGGEGAEGEAAPAEKEEPMAFSYADGVLTIKNDYEKNKKAEEKPADEEGADEEMDPAQLAMAKQMMGDMRIVLAIELPGGIAETNASHVEGNTVTMIDLNMGKLLDNPEKFKEFNKKQPGSPAEAKEMLKGIDGIKVETAEKLTIKLK